MVRTTAFWLLIFFTLLFIVGLNSGEVQILLNTGVTICLSCIGIG
ncbi:MAG: CD1871A family CXXC motif-containing protein [Desulfobacca sp.]|nr:CD1871A family CXXC motif-containing protein [Desulfobacca sp.]